MIVEKYMTSMAAAKAARAHAMSTGYVVGMHPHRDAWRCEVTACSAEFWNPHSTECNDEDCGHVHS